MLLKKSCMCEVQRVGTVCHLKSKVSGTLQLVQVQG